MMEAFDAYGHALISVALTALLWAVLGPVSSVMKEKLGVAPGGGAPEDYALPAYRWQRAYQNLTEGFAPFAAAALAAMMAGAAPFWVNLLASLFLVSRLAVAFVHVRGLGKPSGGARSILFTVGWVSTIVLALLTVLAVF